MEFERAIFRIHERMLSSPCIKGLMYICTIVSTVLLILIMSVFIFANVKYKGKSNILTPDYIMLKEFFKENRNFSGIPKQDIIVFKICDFTKEDNSTNSTKSPPEKNNSTTFAEGTARIQEENSSSTNNGTIYKIGTVYETLEFALDKNIIKLGADARKALNINHTLMLLEPSRFYDNTFEKFLVKSLVGFETILINQLIFTIEGDVKAVRNVATEELWMWTQEEINQLNWSNNGLVAFGIRLGGIIKIIFGIFLVSNITAIYILITIVVAPLFILMIFECCARIGPANDPNNLRSRLTLYKAFPWIGVYLYALHSSNRKDQGKLFLAFFFMILIFYFLYLCSIYLWTNLLYSHSYPRGIDENFYGFIAFLEFTSLLFIRTRTSLKYFPKFVFLYIFTFLVYIQFNIYPFFFLGFYIILFLSLATTGLFLILCEIPATSWNPAFHYTPSSDKPRVLYLSLFSMSWYYDLPQIWTMFYPLHDRSHFSISEMSLLDRNYVLLNNTMTNAIGLQENAGDNMIPGVQQQLPMMNINPNQQNRPEPQPQPRPQPQPQPNQNQGLINQENNQSQAALNDNTGLSVNSDSLYDNERTQSNQRQLLSRDNQNL